MLVHVTLKGSLSLQNDGGERDVELNDNATIEDVAVQLNLRGQHCIFVVNGTAVQAHEPLREGARVVVFPPVSGGATGGDVARV